MTEQGTQAWKDERAGNVTASRISAVTCKPRKGQKESATRSDYRAQLICEILTGKPAEQDFQTWDMKRGIELEPFARAAYEVKTGVLVDTVGFVQHGTIERAGCSPDGLIGEEGLVQFKAPKRAKHMDWFLAGIVPIEHRQQMYFEMACTGRAWNDFCSYCPDFPPDRQLFIVRLKRDDVAIAEIEKEVCRFIAEVEEMIVKLNAPVRTLEEQLQESIAIANARKQPA